MNIATEPIKNYGVKYTVKNNRIYDLPENEEKKGKLFYMLMKQDEELIAKEARETKNGVCTKCWCYIPMSGHCDCD